MSTTASYSVSGMTCAHCVAAVTEEVGRLAGVSAVDVDLNAGGDSRVTVTSDGAVAGGRRAHRGRRGRLRPGLLALAASTAPAVDTRVLASRGRFVA